jgi:heavy metal sensor kinase
MRESLRGRLLLWHLVALATVIILFSASVATLVWRARLAEIDASLVTEATLLASAVKPAEGGAFDLRLAPELRSRGPASYYAIWTRDGRLIDRSDTNRPEGSPPQPGTLMHDGLRELVIELPAGALVLVGRDLSEIRRDVWSLLVTLLGVGAVMLVLSVISGWFLVGRALEPIDRINRTAQRMIEGDLAARIPVERVHTELGQVGRALNDAFDQLRASVARQRRFTADASHELRTPLATLSTEAQWALGRERSAEAYRESIVVCLRAAARMQAIVERLLTLARADDPTAADAPTANVDLDDLLRQILSEVKPLADGRRLSVRYSGQPAVIRGRVDELRDAVTNVIVNAIRYNVEGGTIDVTVARDETATSIVVRDTGIGIAPDDLPSIFDPFFRADSSRSHDAGGAGLGLTVTKAVVERHGGAVTCTSEPSRGTTVVVTWPTGRYA